MWWCLCVKFEFRSLWTLVGSLSGIPWSWHCSLSKGIFLLIILQVLCVKFLRRQFAQVFGFFIMHVVPLALKCHLSLLSMGVDDIKSWMPFFAYSLTCLALKSSNTTITSLAKLAFILDVILNVQFDISIFFLIL